MKIAVTDTGSFVGARVIESFHLGDGPTLVAVASEPRRLVLTGRFALESRLADPLDQESLARALAGCGAAVCTTQGDATQTKRIPVVFCRAAAQAGVRRVVYLSTAFVHGDNPEPGTDEKSPLHLRHTSETTNARVAAERHFFSECQKLGLAGYALRPGLIYGPRAQMFDDLVQDLRDERATLARRGEGICNAVYVDNLVGAIRLCLKAKNGTGQPYLITDAETVTWREFYHGVAHQLDLPVRIREIDSTGASQSPFPAHSAEPWPRPGQPGSPEETGPAHAPSTIRSLGLAALQQCEWKLPSERAARQLGYRPAVTFEEGLRRTCAWWRFAQGEFFAAA